MVNSHIPFLRKEALMRLQDKVIVVTGASAGMGRAMVEAFAREGAKVVAVARRQELLEELAEECKDLPGEVTPFAGNCAKEETCEAMIRFAAEKYGKVDSLVNNAGIMDDTAAVGDFSDEYLTKIYNLNTFGVLYAMRAAVRQFLSQERPDPDMPFANILNITSIGAQHANAGVVYCSAKAAIESATKHTAFMYMKEGIRVNAIAPGGVLTDIMFSMPPQNEFGTSRTGLYNAMLNRLGQPTEIAEAAVFLVSDEASYVSGQILGVNGGWLCY
ncbi:MAG: SDR family oxidoreductase [Firmicutes bacterium]|nr:SDR family oxidoreductase [Bacillota bacterium]